MNSHARRVLVSIATLCLLLTPSLAAAQGTLADYQRAERFLGGNLRSMISVADIRPAWIADSDRFWYRSDGPKGAEFIVVDAAKNTSTPAFDHARLAAALSRAARQPYEATRLPFYSFDYVDKESAIRFQIEATEWTCKLSNYECTKSSRPEMNPYENVSPDGRWAAYLKDHNLFLRDTSTGEVVQLTRDGVPGWDYATPLPDLRTLVTQGVQRGEDVKARPEVFWSPDSSKLITFRIDSRSAGRFTTLQFVPPDQLRPKAFDYVYPLPGEALPHAQVMIFDVLSGKRVDVKTAPLDLEFQGGPGYFRWFPDNKSFFYERGTRGNKETELRVVDAETGEQKILINEEDGLYIDPGEHFFRYIQENGGILWSSEKDGLNQLYLYDEQGHFKNQVTKGSWVVRQIENIDAKSHEVYFLASGREKNEDPYLTHLYRVNLDGSDLTLLTPENANHNVSVSPDGRYFVDNYSRVDLPGESVLRSSKDGSVIRVLEKTDVSALLKTGWKNPEPFEGKALDNKTDLYGVIVRPSNFDPSKKYPIVEQVYTGPQGFFVPKSFGAALRLQSMAELGFVVVMVDGRGTTGRSRAFHEFSYHNLGGSFADHVAMIKQMAAKYSYMDITRVGIYGTSAGGYGSAHAILQFPDFYKVCVSTSGDHDPRLDKAWWNEQYQGYPVGKDYEEQSNTTMADQLKGHLLLIHGDIDNNVNPVETMRLVDALMTANKNFDMLYVPNMFHGDSGPHALYVSRRRWDYFVQHLLGVTPPTDFQIRERRLPPIPRRP
ncbi:MAG TPA: DPP IV N-terminal domain-containing protein [Candidatus Acidoferrales bacterium]|nr:DPP IV N-terminal domain-containing protein [Candidatus Acidoferrales bacterium]